jgi:flagellar protein FliO/FliZ
MVWMQSVGLLDVEHTAYSLVRDWSTTIATVGQFFYMLIVFVVVLGLAYFTTRFVASAKMGRMGGRRNLEVVESMGVGAQSFIHIVRTGDKYVLIGVTRGQVTMLGDIDKEQLILPEGGTAVTFESFLNKYRNKKDDDPPQQNNRSEEQ